MRLSKLGEVAVETLAYEARSFITTYPASLAESAGLTGSYPGLNGREGESSAARDGDGGERRVYGDGERLGSRRLPRKIRPGAAAAGADQARLV